MLCKYQLNGEEVDSIDLKALLVTRGIKVSSRIYKKFSGTCRLYPDPLTCNCLILPDQTIVQMTDVALHMNYIKSAMSWDTLKNLKYFLKLKTPFELDLSDIGQPVLLHNGEKITEVQFPLASKFYDQETSSGLPYKGNAVLQGIDVLAFQCLWPCEFAKRGYSCQFCYSGGVAEHLARKHKPEPQLPTAKDVAEITDYAVNKEKTAKFIEITGGSTFNSQAECGVIKNILAEVDSTVGLKNLQGEVLVYTTPPSDPEQVDQVFAAGADRVICSLEVQDEALAEAITPGKIKFVGREKQLNCLKYISKQYGPNRACSNFVIGLEPLDSLLQGAEALAVEGIVPLASVWIPFGRPVMGKMQAPNLDFYRRVKERFAEIYVKYGIEPPGDAGFNVCMDRDVWVHRSEVT